MDPLNPISPDRVRVFARLAIHCSIKDGTHRLTTAKRMATRRREEWWAWASQTSKRTFWETHFDETLPQYHDRIPDRIPELTWHLLGDMRDSLVAAELPYQDPNQPIQVTPHQARKWLMVLEAALARLEQVPDGFDLGLGIQEKESQGPNQYAWRTPSTSATTP